MQLLLLVLDGSLWINIGLYRCDGISEENGESLRISLGGASALTGHRQDARLVRIDAARRAASFEFGLQPWR